MAERNIETRFIAGIILVVKNRFSEKDAAWRRKKIKCISMAVLLAAVLLVQDMCRTGGVLWLMTKE